MDNKLKIGASFNIVSLFKLAMILIVPYPLLIDRRRCSMIIRPKCLAGYHCCCRFPDQFTEEH